MVIAGSLPSRPRRAAAVESVKRVTNTLNFKSTQAVANKKSVPQLSRRKEKSTAESENDSSELSDVESEEEDDLDEVGFEDGESSSESERDAGNGSDYEESGGKRKKGVAKAQRKGAAVKKVRKNAATKKTPVKKTTTKAKKSKNAGPRKTKTTVSKEDLPLKEDNKLFNCIKDGDADLQSTAQDWVEYYQDNPGMSLAQLINCFFRCSGCNATIDEVQVLDHDNIAEVLDLIQLEMKTTVMPSYPLVSRSPKYRKFRRRLSDWMENLMICVDEADIVYDDTMMETLTAWISAMSTSAFRSMRHTSTLIALFIVEQINRMSQANRAEVEAAINSRNAEKSKGSASKVRLNDLNKKVQEANQIKKQLDELLQEMFDTVYIHRYRDSDATIRAECIGELGRWMKSYPDKYLQTTYFRYTGWALSDMSEKVRLVAVKCLSTLYARQEYTGSFQQFTERFLSRLIEMAVGDVDSSVRTATISTLTQIDENNVLDEEAKDLIASHIFDVEPKVRGAVATFIKVLLDDQQAEEEEESDDDEEEEGKDLEAAKIRWKLLAQLLTRLSENLQESETVEEGGNSSDGVKTLRINSSTASRLALAVGALWDVDEKIHDWTALVQLLLYDHTHQKTSEGKGRKKKAGTNTNAVAPDNEAYRLESAEEGILLEALPVVLERTQSQRRGPEGTDTVIDNHFAMTRDLIPALPKLFTKYKTEANRIVEVLVVAKELKIEAYLEFQQIGAFESLWDEVIDQFLRHVEPNVLHNAVEAMAMMKQASALNNVNHTKLSYLRQTTFESLHDCVNGLEDLTTDELNEEQLHALTASASRIKYLIRRNDLCQEMEEGGNEQERESATNPWDILLACAKRGSLGHEKEESMVSDAIVSLTLYIMWSTRRIRSLEDGDAKVAAVTALCEKRADFVMVLSGLLNEEMDEVRLVVKRQAFKELVDLYILFAAVEVWTNSTEQGGLRLKCDIATQQTMASFVRSELKRYTDEVDNMRSENDESEEEGDENGKEDEEDDDDDDDEASQRGKSKKRAVKTTKKKVSKKRSNRPTLGFLQRQVDFVSTISHFISAIRLGIVHVKFSIEFLSRYSRIGFVFDACLRVLVELIREIGINEGKANQACNMILGSLWEAHCLYCKDKTTTSDTGLVNFAKMISSSLVVRGAQLAILKSIDGEAVMKLHTRGMKLTFEKLQKLSEEGGEDVSETTSSTLIFFKVLSQLLISVKPQEAIKIKKEMDELIKTYEIEIPLTSKAWDPLRQYEKRLVTIASKSDSVRKHIEASKQTKKQLQPRPKSSIVQQMQGEEEGEEEEEEEEEGDAQQEQEDSLMDDSRLDAFGGGDETRDDRQMDLTIEEEEEEEEEDDG